MIAKILLIDDDIELTESLTDILELDGYEILVANRGSNGIEIATHQLPDLIICDYKMPGMSGCDVIAELQQDDRTKDISIILATGFDSSQLDDIPLSVSTIAKPFNIEFFLETVSKHLPAHCA